MSITVYSGTLDKQSASGQHSVAITLPADANFVYVLVTGYHGDNASTDKFFDDLNFDGAAGRDFTFIGNNKWSTSYDFQCEAWYMDDSDPNWPGTGSKTLYWRPWGNAAAGEGFNVFIGWMAGVDTSGDPIAAYTSGPQGTSGTSPLTISLTGVGANDVSVILGYSYAANVDEVPTGYGQTSLAHDLFNSAGIGASYKVGASSMRLESSTNIVGLAFAVKAAAAANDGNPSTVERSGSLLMGAA